ncbi:hypothetical protein V8F20_010163 [Naviculisporaceae sp. PSN 640]
MGMHHAGNATLAPVPSSSRQPRDTTPVNKPGLAQPTGARGRTWQPGRYGDRGCRAFRQHQELLVITSIFVIVRASLPLQRRSEGQLKFYKWARCNTVAMQEWNITCRRGRSRLKTAEERRSELQSDVLLCDGRAASGSRELDHRCPFRGVRKEASKVTESRDATCQFKTALSVICSQRDPLEPGSLLSKNRHGAYNTTL